MATKNYDFCGWATKANMECSDGRIIGKDAFKDNDKMRVPLMWGHDHADMNRVIGHADLENREEGVYVYGTFNDTESGRTAKMLVQHGDINALSIYANKLKQKMLSSKKKLVTNGNIKEVSLVVSGANPEAYIEDVVMAHSDDAEFEAEIYTGEYIELYHEEPDTGDDLSHEDGEKKKDPESDGKAKKTVQDVLDTLNEEQKDVVYGLIGQAIEDAKAGKLDGKKEDDDDMKHNAFDKGDQRKDDILSHSDQEAILTMAKNPKVGTFQNALQIWAEENALSHEDAAKSSGFIQTEDDGNVSWLFPEYKDVRPGAPELVTNDQGWISTVLSKVHKSPISRIRTQQVDIRNADKSMDELRARGYKKGNKKVQTGNFKLARRTTDPQTVYVKSALYRDDIIDITDLDVVQYLYNIDRMQLNEELATAIMLGDGREDRDVDKIDPNHIRPIWTDDDLYTQHVDIDLESAKKELQGTNTGANFGENYILAEAMISAALYARENYKGSGTPDMFITPHMLNVMLLARDMNGRRIYSSVSELASSFNVGEIHTAEQFAGKERADKEMKKHKLVAILCNMADYTLGATKGGQITHFTQFDIDFNQEKSLLETRCSGALTRIYSAIAIEEPVAGE